MRRPNPTLRAEDALARWDAAGRSTAAAAPLTVKCTLMTPIYGGGVTPGEVDCNLPVRPSAIRGQLRFWWRLLNGINDDSEKTFAAESDLWGGISSKGPKASRVTLHVEGEPVVTDQMVRGKSRDIPSYSLILERSDDPLLLRADYEFTVALGFAETATAGQREQVVEALRWWASFGGVGARTRRGLGAVRATSDDIDLKPVSRDEVESRGGRMVLRGPRRNAADAWKNAVDALKNFRQGDMGRKPGTGNRPGRSRWPEPDTIRRHTGRHAPGHEPAHEVKKGYPRAAFGLPIVFHFKDKNRGDPHDLTLNPANGDRMASPLILRPHFSENAYRPLALLLPGWEQRVSVPVKLDRERAEPAWPEDPNDRQRLANRVDPMRDRGADTLAAFMDYFDNPGAHGRERSAR